MTRKTSGFTLIELMIVIAIIAIIAAIAIPNLLRSRVAGNEQNAAAGLRTMTVVQAGWRQGDYDGNGVKDFWVGDVMGLYGVVNAGGTARENIAIDFAKADSSPLQANGDGTAYAAAVIGVVATSKQGYFFEVLETDELGVAYPQVTTAIFTTAVTNRSKFGFTAYPETYDGTGVRQFVVREDGSVYGLDLGDPAGVAQTDFPAVDPTSLPIPWAVEGD